MFWSHLTRTDLVLLWRLMDGVGQLSVRLEALWCETESVPACSDWVRLYWLMWMLWELKQKPSSTSDWNMADSGVSASGGREMSSGDAQSYSSLDRESSGIASCCRSSAEASWENDWTLVGWDCSIVYKSYYDSALDGSESIFKC